MPTYQQLTSLDFAQLNQAVEDWNTTAQRMTELGEESSDGMLAKTRAANWFGMNATASGERIEQAALAFTYAGSQASGIYGVLRDFRDRQKDCQQRLRELSEEAWGKGLSVTPDGQVVARGGNAYTDDNGNQQYRLTDEEAERLYRQGDYSQFQPPELQAEINSIKALQCPPTALWNPQKGGRDSRTRKRHWPSSTRARQLPMRNWPTSTNSSTPNRTMNTSPPT
ncbi:hypothetical protein [Streptomyces harbinensis]|uniref:hypothetical protein n=1 Tax=Streptomyces harbinensis TaxID=1176198 RepID=UPI0034DE057F